MEIWRDKRLHSDLMVKIDLELKCGEIKSGPQGMEGGEAGMSELLARPDRGRGTTCW